MPDRPRRTKSRKEAESIMFGMELRGERGDHCALGPGHKPHILHSWAMDGYEYPCGGAAAELAAEAQPEGPSGP